MTTARARTGMRSGEDAGRMEEMAFIVQKKKKKVPLFYCGFVSGMFQAALFNPWDRALYLTIKENRDFLHVENFKQPFSGLMQTLFQRTVSAGLYFPLEDIFLQSLLEVRESRKSHVHDHWVALAAGNLAGAVSGLVLNPLAAVKYHTWGICEAQRENFFRTCQKLYHHGGFKPFVTGTFATVSRDMTFGGCFSVIRHGLHSKVDGGKNCSSNENFLIDMVAAICGTVVSSPLNYVRNMHYATNPGEKLLSSQSIMKDLWSQAKLADSFFHRILFLQHQLRIGWGTLRVGCGMAVGGKIYSMAVAILAPEP